MIFDIQCDHEVHACKDIEFIFVNDVKEFVFLEVPKNASTFIKSIIEEDSDTRRLTRAELIHNSNNYKGYFVFAVYREMEERATSVFKNFTDPDNTFRLKQMSRLFGISIEDVLKLNFTDFLEYALVKNDHHWNSQIKFLCFQNIEPQIYRYSIIENLFAELQARLGYHFTVKIINSSPDKEVLVSDYDRSLIKRIYVEDFENEWFFRKYLVN